MFEGAVLAAADPGDVDQWEETTSPSAFFVSTAGKWTHTGAAVVARALFSSQEPQSPKVN